MQKFNVHRRFYWGMSKTPNRTFLHRFASFTDMLEWEQTSRNHRRESAKHSAIRKINRQIAAGSMILFPLEIQL